MNLRKPNTTSAGAMTSGLCRNWGFNISGTDHLTSRLTPAPPDQPFVVIEPQFNWADPFSPLWSKDVNTGMVVLMPCQEVTWAVRVELFTT
jgi:aldose 1-epimerase